MDGNELNIPKLIIKVDSNPFLLNYHLETDFLELFYPNEFLPRQI